MRPTAGALLYSTLCRCTASILLLYILLYLHCCSRLWRNLTMHNARSCINEPFTPMYTLLPATFVVEFATPSAFSEIPILMIIFYYHYYLFLNVSFLFSVLVTVSIRPYNIYTYICIQCLRSILLLYLIICRD